MNKQEAMLVVVEEIRSESLLQHSMATEYVMRTLATRFSQDDEMWGVTGLLHDIDYEATKMTPKRHGAAGGDLLINFGAEDEIIHAVMAHNDATGIARDQLMDKALYCAGAATQLIIAASKTPPQEGIEDVTLEILLAYEQDESFCPGASRKQLAACKEIEMELDEFLALCLASMRKKKLFLEL